MRPASGAVTPARDTSPLLPARAVGLPMAGLRLFQPRAWRRREAPPPPASPGQPADAARPSPADASASAPPGRPFPRPAPVLRHEWLDVAVARATLLGPLPVGRTRVVVRAWPPGEPRPLDAVARAFTDAEGLVSFHLPAGRYALTATQGEDAKTVAVTVEHAGRATIVLEEAPRLRLRTLVVEVVDSEGRPVAGVEVEAASLAPEGPSCRSRTDERGLAPLALLPGAYEVRAAGRAARVQVHGDARLRLAALAPAGEMDALLREAATTLRAYERPDDAPAN